MDCNWAWENVGFGEVKHGDRSGLPPPWLGDVDGRLNTLLNGMESLE